MLRCGEKYEVLPASKDEFCICLVLINCQLTFCLLVFQLVVSGAIDDMKRLCTFMYQNSSVLSKVVASLDSHIAMQIFHSPFLVDEDGNNPFPYTQICAEDVLAGKWRVDDDIAEQLGLLFANKDIHLPYYVKELLAQGKGSHTVWSFHAMLGVIEHVLVPALHEAIFFHSVLRKVNPLFEIKGLTTLSESYSVFGPEVKKGCNAIPLGQMNSNLVKILQTFDAVIWEGEAGSHCLAWAIADYLFELQKYAPSMRPTNYILEDCTSPVIIHGVVDLGVHLVKSTEPIETWPCM